MGKSAVESRESIRSRRTSKSSKRREQMRAGIFILFIYVGNLVKLKT